MTTLLSPRPPVLPPGIPVGRPGWFTRARRFLQQLWRICR
jgi:hypothetical protein